MFVDSEARRALAAERTGIVKCIKFCATTGLTMTDLALVIDALLGAAWLETNDIENVAKMVKHLEYVGSSLIQNSELT